MKAILSRILPAVLLLALFLLGAARAGSTDLITNGDFETGDLSGWSVQTIGDPSDTSNSRNFYISAPGADTPVVNSDPFTDFATAANSGGGNFYAVSTADFAGESALYQRFTVGAGTTSLTYAFQMFVNDQSGFGAVVDPSGLDYTTGGTFNDNQHARVDILKGSATDLFSISASDIVATLYGPGVDSANPADYTSYTGDLTSVLTPGSYYLRFAEVDNLGAINLGVDNISLTAVSNVVVPEAASPLLLLCALPLMGLLFYRRRFVSPSGGM